MLIQLHLHQYEVYLYQQQNWVFPWIWCGDEAMWGYNRKIIISIVTICLRVRLLEDLLACKKYCNGKMQVKNKHLLYGICRPKRMTHGACKSYQCSSSNWVATIWQDNKVVRLVITNSIPGNVVHTDRRLGHNVIQINQPQNIPLYNRCMNGVDYHDQLHMKYDVVHFSIKAWKYTLWYL